MRKTQPHHHTPEQGFTLLELLLAITMVAGLATMAAGYYVGAFRKLSLGSSVKILTTDLQTAHSYAVQGEFAQKWGVHVVNGATDYYEIYRTPTDYTDGTKTITQTVQLPTAIEFTDPASSTTKDILFSRTTGRTATSTSITIQDTNSGNIQSIQISDLGLIE